MSALFFTTPSFQRVKVFTTNIPEQTMSKKNVCKFTLVTRLTGPGVRTDLSKNAYPHWVSFFLGQSLIFTAWALLSLWITSYAGGKPLAVNCPACCPGNNYKREKQANQSFEHKCHQPFFTSDLRLVPWQVFLWKIPILRFWFTKLSQGDKKVYRQVALLERNICTN